MPAHSSNKLQFLDIGCFRSLKDVYSDLVKQKISLEVSYIDKLNFLQIFSETRKSAFTIKNIQNSFTGTDLVLFNPDRVLNKLDIQLKISTPPGSRSTNSASKISYTTRQLEKQTSAARKLLKEYTQSPFPLLETRLDKIIKNYELTFNKLILAKEEIRKYCTNNK